MNSQFQLLPSFAAKCCTQNRLSTHHSASSRANLLFWRRIKALLHVQHEETGENHWCRLWGLQSALWGQQRREDNLVTTTAGFARVKWSSKSLQGTIMQRECGKFYPLAWINPQAQADTLQKLLSFDFNKNKCAHSWVNWQWHKASWCLQQMLIKIPNW